jgi:hypothetical protein
LAIPLSLFQAVLPNSEAWVGACVAFGAMAGDRIAMGIMKEADRFSKDPSPGWVAGCRGFQIARAIPRMTSLDYVSIPNRQLTENFWLYEFLVSDNAAALRLDNTPDADQLANIERLAEKLQSIRSMLSFHFVNEVFIDITSGFRSRAVNKAAGGLQDIRSFEWRQC